MSRKFAREVIKPNAAKYDKSGEVRHHQKVSRIQSYMLTQVTLHVRTCTSRDIVNSWFSLMS